MRYICFTILLLLSLSSYSQETVGRRHFNFRVEFMGVPVEDTGPFGLLLSAGYDFSPFPKKSFFSIEPRIAGGALGGKKHEGILDEQVYKYIGGCYSLGVIPKFYIPLFEDEIDLFLENEFSFMSTFLTIYDYNVKTGRGEKNLFSFYYSCRAGALFHLKKADVSCWLGFTTLNITEILNRNLPVGRHRFSEQRPWISYGVGIAL